MKTYVSLGIGDLFFLDSILTLEEKESISELYWACRFGYIMQRLMENNPSYPNLKAQYTIADEVGKEAMALWILLLFLFGTLDLIFNVILR